MIVFTRFSLVELSVQGKNFNWKKPDICPSCKSLRLWGHGYRLARFVGVAGTDGLAALGNASGTLKPALMAFR